MPIFSQAHIDLESQSYSIIQAEDTEAGGSQIQGLPGLQNNFKTSLSNLEKTCHKKNQKTKTKNKTIPMGWAEQLCDM